MSCVMDGFSRENVKTAKGNLVIDTRYVPFPLGRDNWETAVFTVDKSFSFGRGTKMIEATTSATKEEADVTHTAMINKYLKVDKNNN